MPDLSKSMWNVALQPLKTNLYCHNAYGNQTWKGVELQWGAPTDKDAWPFAHVILWDHVTN